MILSWVFVSAYLGIAILSAVLVVIVVMRSRMMHDARLVSRATFTKTHAMGTMNYGRTALNLSAYVTPQEDGTYAASVFDPTTGWRKELVTGIRTLEDAQKTADELVHGSGQDCVGNRLGYCGEWRQLHHSMYKDGTYVQIVESRDGKTLYRMGTISEGKVFQGTWQYVFHEDERFLYRLPDLTVRAQEFNLCERPSDSYVQHINSITQPPTPPYH
jgi:hypothetical protein